MDSVHFDGYTSYSESSTPRTPSPRTSLTGEDMHFTHSPHFKANLDPEPVRNIFAEHQDDGIVSVADVHQVNDPTYWAPSHTAPVPNPFAFNNNSRGSLLQELYDHDIAEQQQHPSPERYEQSAEPSFNGAENWSQMPSHEQHHHQQSSRPHDYQMMRRATFPYVRHDREDGMPMQQYPPFMQNQHHHENMLYSRQDGMYSEHLPLTSEPGSMHGEFIPSLSASPHSQYSDFGDNTSIKLEDNTPMMIPSQGFYRPSSSGGCHPIGMSYLSPHTGLPVQHTDDAASKETQYLRRRCYNCHTTEPPSWRRSTLNPGKIVCNKCGLYERTHLRPRPLRFDELRAGNKARKQSKGTVSPKVKLAAVKKEPREFGGLVRRSSVSSSSASSVHSGSGASDWDDNVSVYSSGSAPPTSFNSPNLQTFPLSRESQSPPRDGGIRLPNAPLSDIASLQSQTPSLPHPQSPRKAHTSPGYFSPPTTAQAQQQEFYQRSAQEWQGLPPTGEESGSNLTASPLPTSIALA
ncbi:hypothetical protein BDQ12DRAFT_596392 [Crucibulum laeve]|uniref:GATA-type domain-containing protein n=1 Tax=Crucibulum laeve TaxID=68775 RepID=A0A5C3MF76_9AGAR|nr:hypothetical protein BDQ12DRAFT_596392 [Crucibulum laeve]